MNAELLREVYALVSATPSALLDLERYRSDDGRGCMIGLMARNGMIGVYFDKTGAMKVKEPVEGETEWQYVARMLGIKVSELIDIASVRGHSLYDYGAPQLSDKDLLLYRIEHLFRDRGVDLNAGDGSFRHFMAAVEGFQKEKAR